MPASRGPKNARPKMRERPESRAPLPPGGTRRQNIPIADDPPRSVDGVEARQRLVVTRMRALRALSFPDVSVAVTW